MTLFYLALAWLAGIALATLLTLPWWAWGAASAILIAVVIILRQRPLPRLLAGCLLMAALGGLRLALSVTPITESALAYYNDGSPVAVFGLIGTAPDTRDQQTSFTVRVEHIELPDGTLKPVTGKLLVQTFPLQAYRYGDPVTVHGTLETPPEGSYRDYLARQGVLSMVRYAQVDITGERAGNPFWAFLFDWRERARQNITRLLPEPESSLLSGILLGLDSGISPSLRADFNATGTSHIIAISGSNIAIIAGLILTLSRRLFKETPAAVITIVSVIVYTLFVGADAAVVRAAIMTTLGLTAARLGRQTYGPASLGFAALLMTAITPLTLWDVGFQLSFMATLGLILYVEPLQQRLAAFLSRFLSEGASRTVLAFISDAFVVTVAAQITTTPLIAFYFGRLSLLSLPANFLIIPLQAPLMVFGWLGVLMSFVLWPLGQFFAWMSWLFLAFTVRVVQTFAALPLASFTLEIPLAGLVLIYAIIFGLTIMVRQPTETRPAVVQELAQGGWVRLAGLLGILIAAILLISAFSAPDGQLHITLIDSGGQPSALLVTPGGRVILVGAGGTGRELASALGQSLPFWQRRLDLVILIDTNQDAAGALSSLTERYRVSDILSTPGENGALLQASFDKLAQQGTRQQVAITGQIISVGDGARLTVLSAQSGQPLALLLTFGDFRMLFPADPQAPVGALLAPEALGAALLISSPANTALTDPGFLSSLQPQMIILPASSAAVAPPSVISTRLYTIPVGGRLELVTDGQHITVTSR